ncbi:unnamed protein product [Citrullus colocynthis]|uniref:Uncharacterized protein n=1 Tax=Citrullus colocynthis TaxID=252529 RepID=A0ABP0Y7V8_9ROSI
MIQSNQAPASTMNTRKFPSQFLFFELSAGLYSEPKSGTTRIRLFLSFVSIPKSIHNPQSLSTHIVQQESDCGLLPISSIFDCPLGFELRGFDFGKEIVVGILFSCV